MVRGGGRKGGRVRGEGSQQGVRLGRILLTRPTTFRLRGEGVGGDRCAVGGRGLENLSDPPDSVVCKKAVKPEGLAIPTYYPPSPSPPPTRPGTVVVISLRPVERPHTYTSGAYTRNQYYRTTQGLTSNHTP